MFARATVYEFLGSSCEVPLLGPKRFPPSGGLLGVGVAPRLLSRLLSRQPWFITRIPSLAVSCLFTCYLLLFFLAHVCPQSGWISCPRTWSSVLPPPPNVTRQWAGPFSLWTDPILSPLLRHLHRVARPLLHHGAPTGRTKTIAGDFRSFTPPSQTSCHTASHALAIHLGSRDIL
jgi:hypothetical protein